MKILIKIMMGLVFAVGFICWGLGLTASHNSKPYQLANQKLEAKNNQYQSKLNQMTTQKQPLVTQANDALTKVFMIDWTFNDQAAFDAKRATLKPLVTANVYQHALDLQADSHKTVAQTGVMVSFDSVVFLPSVADKDNVAGKAVVTINSNNNGQQSATTKYIYDVAYNPSSMLITQLDRQGEFVVTGDTQEEHDE
ncbi:hypothetical protein [Leuconostoc pseudomesenteroides]|uniref:hypothetical protein n=1 Tax=Leuconostoc pseudomesenteroides TaxID=33968 RepID=UPI0039EBDE67